MANVHRRKRPRWLDQIPSMRARSSGSGVRYCRMPSIRVNGAEIFYREEGSGPEAVLFAHGVLWSSEMFAAQMAALRDRYRCVAFDFRGQGRSEVTAGGYDMETLTADALALIEALALAPC